MILKIEGYDCFLDRNIFYIGNQPAIIILENGEVDLICPDAARNYLKHKKECDLWIEKQKTKNKIYE